jgi:hypothetical protein
MDLKEESDLMWSNGPTVLEPGWSYVSFVNNDSSR